MQGITRREKERLMHEEEIVLAAENLFCSKGYEKTSIDEIAREVKFTRRTVYQYFKNKEDLYYAVTLRGFRKLSEYFAKAIDSGKNGFDKFYKAGLAYYQFYQDFPGTFNLMNHIGFVRSAGAMAPKYRDFLQFNNTMFNELGKVIDEGKRDGSIRNDIDTEKGTYTLAFIITGFINQVSMTGKSFADSRNIDLDSFVKYAYDFLTEVFRSHSVSAK